MLGGMGIPRKLSLHLKREIATVRHSPAPPLPTKQYAIRRNQKITTEDVRRTLDRKTQCDGKHFCFFIFIITFNFVLQLNFCDSNFCNSESPFKSNRFVASSIAKCLIYTGLQRFRNSTFSDCGRKYQTFYHLSKKRLSYIQRKHV